MSHPRLGVAIRTDVKGVARVLVVALVATALSGVGWTADNPRFTRDAVKVDIPAVTLVDQDGDRVDFRALTLSDKPVFVDFIFATCTTICPVLSAGFASLQKKLTADGKAPRLVSISIDPDHDTPAVMKEYLRRYRASPGWDFLTGSRADVELALRALNAYVPNKMAHYPLVLMRSPADGTWVRLFGLMGTKDLVEEYRKVTVR